jgi:hypothetical protein
VKFDKNKLKLDILGLGLEVSWKMVNGFFYFIFCGDCEMIDVGFGVREKKTTLKNTPSWPLLLSFQKS